MQGLGFEPESGPLGRRQENFVKELGGCYMTCTYVFSLCWIQRQLIRIETSLEIGSVSCGDLLYDKGGSNQEVKNESSVKLEQLVII